MPIEWRDDMENAPRDRPIQARIPGYGEDNIIAWTTNLLDENEEDCGGWYFAEDREPPDCWTDGICWASNEDEKPSVKPTHWKLPKPPTETGDQS